MKEIERNCCNCRYSGEPKNTEPCCKCKNRHESYSPQYGAAEDLWEPESTCREPDTACWDCPHSTACVCRNMEEDELPCETGCWRYSVEKAPEEPHIKDSGNRRTFGTDAVRDVCDGKGRCDLMPLDMVSSWMNDVVLCEIASFVQTHRTLYLRSALDAVCGKYYNGQADMMLDLAVHFEEGAKKYGEHNWEKGLPIHSYIDSGVRHYFKVLRGDKDEPHLRACVWNLICAMWTMHHKPELNDLLKREENNND